MKGMRSGLFICLGCRVCIWGMSAARCICLVTKSRVCNPVSDGMSLVQLCES